MQSDNVLVIGDTHLPFEKKHYLDFCIETQKKYQCGKVVHIGDVVDNHSISYHEHHPDGLSPRDEMEQAQKTLYKWFKAFPKVMVCKGNHDILATRKAITFGLSDKLMKPFREVWEFPSGWEYDWNYYLCGVKYQHGTGYSGQTAHMKGAVANRMSTVQGHCHSVAGINWSANELNLIFGMSVGCGIDRMKYAFWYGRDFKEKPIISCGVVLEGGRHPIVVPMKT
jgi:predicted phosphodiesterase